MPTQPAQKTVAPAGQGKLDFRYSPPEWQTAICLPDDPHETLVDRTGELLYHYKQGGREFGTRISVVVANDTKWVGQDLHSPRVPIVKTYRQSADVEITEEAFAVTGAPVVSLPENALKRFDDIPGRDDIILVHLKNTGAASRTITPELIVNTALPLTFRADQGIITVNGAEVLNASLKMAGMVEKTGPLHRIQLEPVKLAAGESASFYVRYSNGTAMPGSPASMQEVVASRANAIEYWEKKSQLPFDRIQVPEPGVQSLIESSMRNIWHAREIKNGLPAFQVGPTCYRGLWIVDGAFLLESAAMVGAGDQARNGVAYELSVQKPDGRMESLAPDFWKENGIVIWTCVRHAQLTQDKVWLESVWPKLQLIAEYIKILRSQTLHNGSTLDDGLNPAGTLDGGIGGTHDEYTNTYWNLTGLKAFIQAAHWLGKNQEAAGWQKEYDAFMLALDRGNDLHLLEGMPVEWTKPGMVTRLNGVATPFGALTLEVKIANDGKSARLRVEPLSDRSCRDIIVHTGAFTGTSAGKVIRLNPGKKNVIDIPVW